jgi:hypothetical protein
LSAIRLTYKGGPTIDGEPVALFTKFERSFTGGWRPYPPGVNAEVVLDHCEGPQLSARQRARAFLESANGNDLRDDFAREACQSREEVRWRSTGL